MATNKLIGSDAWRKHIYVNRNGITFRLYSYGIAVNIGSLVDLSCTRYSLSESCWHVRHARETCDSCEKSSTLVHILYFLDEKWCIINLLYIWIASSIYKYIKKFLKDHSDCCENCWCSIPWGNKNYNGILSYVMATSGSLKWLKLEGTMAFLLFSFFILPPFG